MPNYEALTIYKAPGNDTGVGQTVVTMDGNGINVASPGLLKADSNVINNEQIVTFALVAATVDQHIWIAPEGFWQVSKVRYMPRVAGSDAGAVTADVKVTSGVTAPASGTTQLTATLNLKGTADTLQVGTVIASPTVIKQGDTVALDVTGTLTAVVGLLEVTLKRTA